MNRPYKIVFTDIDWTLISHKKKPPIYDKTSIKYLKKLQKEGVKVFICTARPFHSVDQIHFFNYFKPDGMILSNGGYIIIDDKVIYETKMDQKEFEKICELAQKHNLNIEGIKHYSCFLINDNYKDVKELFFTYPEDLPPIEDYHNQNVIGVTLFCTKEYDDIFLNVLNDDVYFYRYHDHGVDLASELHDKGVAIRKVLEHYGFNKDDAVAIGDDNQDISMFKEVNYGVAMGNAKDEVKKAANFITKDIAKHGVKYALKHMIK